MRPFSFFHIKTIQLTLLIFLISQTVIATSFQISASINIPSDTLSNYYFEVDSVEIDEIILVGNKVTKDRIILRELDFRMGSKISTNNLENYLEQEKNKVFNTDLFVTVDLKGYPVDKDKVKIVIEVIERWYIYAVPLIDFADRNFNEWWKDRNADLSRLEYGIKFKTRNFRGRKENLRVDLLFGFTKNLYFKYDIPFINKKQTTGMSFATGISQNRDVAYKSTGNKLTYASADEVLIRRYGGEIGVGRRSHFYNTHNLILKYSHQIITDSIAELNPDYFLDGRTQQKFFELSYTFTRDLRNMSGYPTKGFYTAFQITKKGLGIFDDLNLLQVHGTYSHFFDLGKNFYYATGATGKMSLPKVQPYNQMQGLGYGQTFVRGFDLYVIEGQAFGLLKNTLRWKALSGRQSIKKIMPLKQFSVIPYSIYPKLFFDTGYAKNSLVEIENEALTNKPIWGTGVGLDLVSFYDSVFRVEYSLNSKMEKNFFFYFSASF